jgi:hypothetical protein
VGGSNVCCTATCSEVSGCGTEAGSCTDVCTTASLTVGRSCQGCGANLANGTCGGGSVDTCNSATHSLCEAVSCGGTDYVCTYAGATWQWRTDTACDDGDICTTGTTCSGGSCTGGSATDMCWDGICNCGETGATCPEDCIAEGDTCTHPHEITGSGTYAGNSTPFNNDYAPGTPSCTGYPVASGRDEVWSVFLAAGQQITVSMSPTSYFDASLYLVTDCTDIPGTCVAGNDDGNPEEIMYTVTSSGTYYIIADGYSSLSYGPYTLTVDIGSATGLFLYFREYINWFADYDEHELLVGLSSSIDPEDGTWTVVADGTAMQNSSAWNTWAVGYKADLEPWSGKSVRFAWHYHGSNSDVWYVDDICASTANTTYPASCDLWSQDFDGVTSPTLPAGWLDAVGSAHNPSATPTWQTSIVQSSSSPNSASISYDPLYDVSRYLVSPAVTLP